MVLLEKVRLIAAKVEGTAGTAESLADADVIPNAFDLEVSPDIEFVPRVSEGTMSMATGVTGPRAGEVKFKTLAIGGVSDPAWASILLPGCGYVAAAGVYGPTSEAPGSNVKTLTIGFYENGRYKQLRGCVGSFVMTCNAGMPIEIEWTFRGVWDAPADAAILNAPSATALPPRFASASFSLAGWAGKIASLVIDAGNSFEVRPTANDVSGLDYGVIGSRAPKATLDPEAELVATQDVYGDWIGHTEMALAATVGTSGNQIVLSAPKAQFTNITNQIRAGVIVDACELSLNRSAAAGDDEFTINLL